MTPDQLKEYVDKAMAHQNDLAILYLVLATVLSSAGAWLGAYMTEKGKNLATKEDIGKITETVKSVESGFDARLEQLKAEFALRGYYNQLRYQREMEIFKDIWPKLSDLNGAVQALRPFFEPVVKVGETAAEKEERLSKIFFGRYKAFEGAVYHNQPFIPPSIWQELRGLLNLFWYEAQDWNLRKNRPVTEYWETAKENKDEIDKHVVNISEAIRARLTDFDMENGSKTQPTQGDAKH